MSTMQFDIGTITIDSDSDIYESTKPEDELMIRHMKLAHMSFNRLIKMTHAGNLTSNLQDPKSSNVMHTCMKNKQDTLENQRRQHLTH
jgi:hypothetical protein